MADSILRRSVVVRWVLGAHFGFVGLMFLAVSRATDFPLLPLGVVLITMAWWLFTGAKDPPSIAVRWVMRVALAVTVLWILVGLLGS